MTKKMEIEEDMNEEKREQKEDMESIAVKKFRNEEDQRLQQRRLRARSMRIRAWVRGWLRGRRRRKEGKRWG